MFRRTHLPLSSGALLLRRPVSRVSTTRTTAVTTTTTLSSSSLLVTACRPLTQVNSGGGMGSESNASRRDQESFLSQYCPLETLGLYEGEASLSNIHAAYAKKKKEAIGNKYKTDQIEKAYSILTDASSLYYERAGWQQTHRQKLMVELLPTGRRRQVKFYMYTWGAIGVVGCFIIAYAFLHPIFRIKRAASR